MIVVQHIGTRWTKRSRGMQGAAARNAVARLMPLPAFPDEPPGIRLHKVMAREEHGFELHQQTEIIEPGQGFTGYWTLHFVPADRTWWWSSSTQGRNTGSPPRRENRHAIFRLEPGQLGTLHINRRFSYSSGQYYKQHSVNITNVETSSHDLFMRDRRITSPT